MRGDSLWLPTSRTQPAHAAISHRPEPLLAYASYIVDGHGPRGVLSSGVHRPFRITWRSPASFSTTGRTAVRWRASIDLPSHSWTLTARHRERNTSRLRVGRPQGTESMGWNVASGLSNREEHMSPCTRWVVVDRIDQPSPIVRAARLILSDQRKPPARRYEIPTDDGLAVSIRVRHEVGSLLVAATRAEALLIGRAAHIGSGSDFARHFDNVGILHVPPSVSDTIATRAHRHPPRRVRGRQAVAQLTQKRTTRE